MRLDRFLWFARVARSRALAQAMASAGRVRLDGRPVGRAAAPVRVGSVLTFASPGGGVRAVRIDSLPARRGPAVEARSCYTELLPAAAVDTENVSQQAPRD